MESAPSVPAVETPAPAAPAKPVSALDAAVENKDIRGVFDARAAVRAGKPLDPVTPAPKASTDAKPPARGPKPKDLEADDRLRTRVAEAVTPLQQKIADLEAKLAATGREPAKTEPPAPSEPEYKRFAKLPDAPKLAEFDSVEDHAAAMAYFVASKLQAEQGQKTAQTEQQRAEAEYDERRVGTFTERFQAAKTADPEFLKDLTDDDKALLRKVTTPRRALPRNERGEPVGTGPEHYLSDFVYDSELMPQLLTHFRQHPDDVARLTTAPAFLGPMPPQTNWNAYAAWVGAFQRYIEQEFYRLEGRLASGGATTHPPADTVSAPPSTLTSAPPPAPTLTKPSTTRDPKTAAVSTGNVGDFLAIRRAEREARAARA